MSNTADTARRERAEKWVREQAQIEDRANWITVDTAYLAGAREEAEIKDAEIAQLRERISRYERTQVDWPIVEGEYKAEIAALRELLKLCEWHERGNHHLPSPCPVCHNSKFEGHAGDCDLRHALEQNP